MIRTLTVLLALSLAACTATYKPVNQPITEVDESTGYRRLTLDSSEDFGDSIILLAFSGGGTRAAALSYGVMQELRDTYITSGGEELRLLDEVDTISSVSGGSFTAAYYGVFRDGLFENYEKAFLRQDVQSTLIRKFFSPGYWLSGATSSFDRTEMAVDFYDRTIFKGATFADIQANGPPYIDINATDLTTGMRFTFGQDLFDLICTDLPGIQENIADTLFIEKLLPNRLRDILMSIGNDICPEDFARPSRDSILGGTSGLSHNRVEKPRRPVRCQSHPGVGPVARR